MHHTIITTADRLPKIQSGTFFSEPAVALAWWRSHNQPQLRFLEVLDDQKVVGTVALCTTDDGKTLQFLGDQAVSDYLDITATTGQEQNVLEQLGQFLSQDQTWETLKLVSVPEQSALRQFLPTFASQQGWQFSEVQQDVCPIIDLPETWEAYLSMIGKKQRHEVTRKWKRLEEQGRVNFEVVTDIRTDPIKLDTFFRLHRLSSVEKAKFWSPEHINYFVQLTTAASQHGWLRLYFLHFNDQPAAVMYCFSYQQKLLVYNSGFDPVTFEGKSVGNVLTAYTIQDAIRLGYRQYDFLRGGEEYKLRYRAVPQPVFNLELRKANGS